MFIELEKQKKDMIGRYRLNPFELHKHLINEYGGLLKRDESKDKTDHDVIRENHQFIWEAVDNADTWEKQLAKKYFDKLFKEYTISDLSRYKDNKVALRWRVEKEVISGKGQFICGEKKCDYRDELRSWEVNFSYIEHSIKKNTLVKLRLCPKCSDKLNYSSKKREIKRLKSTRKKSEEEKSLDKSDNLNLNKSKNTESCNISIKATVPLKSDIVNTDDKTCTNNTNESEEKKCWTNDSNAEEKSREEEFDGYLEDLLL